MKRTTTKSTYNNHTIMTNKERGLACDIKILDEIERQFQYAEATKSKIYFQRMDLRLPEGHEHTNNDLFREFQSKFIKNRSRKGLKPQYVAVREQSKEKHQHYHVALWLDGQKTQNIHDHIATAERLWNKTLGLPERPNAQQELFKKYNDRITSRVMGEFRILPFMGKDIRMQKISRNK